MSGKEQRHVKCPHCGRVGPWLELPSIPFCSVRCKRLDQYKWFAEEHVIASPLDPDLLDEEDYYSGDETEGRAPKNRLRE